jgi:hypothetical protein
MRKVLVLAVVLAGSSFGASAYAHEGGMHSHGTVKEITADRIVITTTEGKDVAVGLDPETRIVRGHQTITPADVRPGERAVVHATNRDGKVEATEVMVAQTAK